MADKAGWCRKTGRGRAATGRIYCTGLFQAIITSSYSKWYSDIWCCYDTSPAFESTPMSTRLYTEWMIPPKCILEFCTNTFSELSKQCRPLSRCIVYAFFRSVAGMCKWARESSKERDRKTKKQREEREKEREREAASFSKRHQLCEQHRQIFHSVSIFLYVPNR